MVDNLTKGRLILGIKSGANQTDIEDNMGMLKKSIDQIMLEFFDLIKKILNSDGFINFASDIPSCEKIKTGKKELGLRIFQ